MTFVFISLYLCSARRALILHRTFIEQENVPILPTSSELYKAVLECLALIHFCFLLCACFLPEYALWKMDLLLSDRMPSHDC